ncbi:MAG: hypothetical protein ACI4KA_01900 [Oscillospiraceae bacterium]
MGDFFENCFSGSSPQNYAQQQCATISYRSTQTEKEVNAVYGVSEVVEPDKTWNIMVCRTTRRTGSEETTRKDHDMVFSISSDRQIVKGCRTGLREVSKGTFELVGCQHRLRYGDQPSPQNLYVNLQITTPAREQISVSLPIESFRDIASLIKTLEEAHISIDKKYLKIWLRDNVPKIEEFTPTTKMIGWWRDEHGKLFTDTRKNSEKVMRAVIIGGTYRNTLV